MSRFMLRNKVSNLVVALGLVCLYSAATNITAEMKQDLSLTRMAVVKEEVISPPQPSATAAPGPIRTGRREAAPAMDVQHYRSPEVIPLPVGRPPAVQVEPDALEVPIRQMPIWLEIPAIELETPVAPAATEMVEKDGQGYLQWLAPDEFAAGWHTTSAWLGEPGNTVLNGHHNIYGEVFARLEELIPGDLVKVYSVESVFTYLVTNTMILPEKYAGLAVRMDNARWILPSEDERLTLVSCWPRESNTHRLIIVASPMGREMLDEREN